MKKKCLKMISMILVSVFAVIGFTGCGSSGNSSSDSSSDSGSAKTVEVALMSGQAPYTYTDTNGNYAGLDYEILKEVQKLVPEYKFHYNMLDWDAACAGVLSGKFALGTACLLRTPAREKSYLLSDNLYYYLMNLVVKPGSNIKSLNDMNGKEISPFPDSDGLAYVLSQWSEAHPDVKFKRESASAAVPYVDAFKGVQAGRWDAWFGDGGSYEAVAAKNSDLHLEVTDYVAAAPTVFIINKNMPDLQKKVNAAIQKLHKEGKIKELCKKSLKKDVISIGEKLTEKEITSN